MPERLARMPFLFLQPDTATPHAGQHPVQFDIEPCNVVYPVGTSVGRGTRLVGVGPQGLHLLVFVGGQRFAHRAHQVQCLPPRHPQRHTPTQVADLSLRITWVLYARVKEQPPLFACFTACSASLVFLPQRGPSPFVPWPIEAWYWASGFCVDRERGTEARPCVA